MSELSEASSQNAGASGTLRNHVVVHCSCGRTATIGFDIYKTKYVSTDPAWSYHADPEDDSKSRLWNCGEPGHSQAGVSDWDRIYSQKPHHVDPSEVGELFGRLSGPGAELQE